MSGYLFVLSQDQINKIDKAEPVKKLTLSAKQWDTGADEIKAGDLVFFSVAKKGSPLTLWATAKAATGAVKGNTGGYVRLSFMKIKTKLSAYPLVEGISSGQTLKDANWKALSNQETAACLFDTVLYEQSVNNANNSLSFKSKLKRSIPAGMDRDVESVFQSVLLNANVSNGCPALRNQYDTEILIHEPRYREVLKERLAALDGRVFEELLKEFFKHSAFEFDDVKTTSKSYDAGIDLLLIRRDAVFGSLLVVGQCKRQIATISAKDIMALATAKNHAKAGRAVFITTSKFSPQAKAVATQDGHIELIDGDRLTELFFQNAEKVPGLWSLVRSSIHLAALMLPQSTGKN